MKHMLSYCIAPASLNNVELLKQLVLTKPLVLVTSSVQLTEFASFLHSVSQRKSLHDALAYWSNIVEQEQAPTNVLGRTNVSSSEFTYPNLLGSNWWQSNTLKRTMAVMNHQDTWYSLFAGVIGFGAILPDETVSFYHKRWSLPFVYHITTSEHAAAPIEVCDLLEQPVWIWKMKQHPAGVQIMGPVPQLCLPLTTPTGQNLNISNLHVPAFVQESYQRWKIIEQEVAFYNKMLRALEAKQQNKVDSELDALMSGLMDELEHVVPTKDMSGITFTDILAFVKLRREVVLAWMALQREDFETKLEDAKKQNKVSLKTAILPTSPKLQQDTSMNVADSIMSQNTVLQKNATLTIKEQVVVAASKGIIDKCYFSNQRTRIVAILSVHKQYVKICHITFSITKKEWDRTLGAAQVQGPSYDAIYQYPATKNPMSSLHVYLHNHEFWRDKMDLIFESLLSALDSNQAPQVLSKL